MKHGSVASSDHGAGNALESLCGKAHRILTLALVGLAVMPLVSRNLVANAADVTVNVATQHQVIDGYGASSAWCGTVPSNVMNVLYGDLGFSILRVRIEEGIGDNYKSGPYTSWAPELANAKAAGITIYAVFVDLNGAQGNSSVLQSCATDTSKYYDLTSSGQIQQAFNDIGLQITNLRVTQ